MKQKLLVTRRLPMAVEERASRTYDARLSGDDKILGPLLLDAARGCDALLVSSSDRINAEVIAALDTSVRVIASYSVGFNHIDVSAAVRRGITVTNTPDVLTEATADLTMLLLLGAARRAGEGHELVRSGQWPKAAVSATFMLGSDLSGATLGIVGMGRIGRALAHRARAFGMTIRYHNRRRLAEADEGGAIYDDNLEALLRASTFVSLNCPSSPESRHIIGAPQLACLPRGAIVVNAARGDLIDDAALVAALQSGQVAAAGLDVFAGEPDIHPAYRQLPNVFLMPHLGSATHKTRDAMGFRALDNIDAVLAGKEAPDVIRV